MNCKFKILTITFIILIISLSNVYAIDMFLTNNSITATSSETITESTIENEDITEMYINNTAVTNPTPTVTYSSSVSESALSLSDIINVILIAVCIVLIFLGIAILIRCK